MLNFGFKFRYGDEDDYVTINNVLFEGEIVTYEGENVTYGENEMDIKDILEVHDFSKAIESTAVLGNTLNRVKIVNALTASGVPLPITANVSFLLTDSTGKVFAVTYLVDADKYAYERLTTV